MAVVLLVINALSLASSLYQAPSTWVVHHPSLESYQLAHPLNVLIGSEGVDERLPSTSVIDPSDFGRPSMFRDILTCGPASIFVEECEPPQWPARFYITSRGNGASLRDCVRSKLPRGYVIERSAIGRDEALRTLHFPRTAEISSTVSLNAH